MYIFLLYKTQGGYMAAKIQKLKDQVKSDGNHGSKSDIFNFYFCERIYKYVFFLKTTSVCCISFMFHSFLLSYMFSEPSAADIKQLILEHGGVFHHYYKRELDTHIIASNLPNSKVANLSAKKVCRPNWITDKYLA